MTLVYLSWILRKLKYCILKYRSISYKQPETYPFSGKCGQHMSWMLSQYVSGIRISDYHITHISNRNIDCSNESEKQGELKILLNKFENNVLQIVLWRGLLICSTLRTNFQVVYNSFIFSALPGCGVHNVFCVSCKKIPEILVVDEMSGGKKYVKRSSIRAQGSHATTRSNNKNSKIVQPHDSTSKIKFTTKTTNQPTKKRTPNSILEPFKTWNWDILFQKHYLEKVLYPAVLRCIIQWVMN